MARLLDPGFARALALAASILFTAASALSSVSLIDEILRLRRGVCLILDSVQRGHGANPHSRPHVSLGDGLQPEVVPAKAAEGQQKLRAMLRHLSYVASSLLRRQRVSLQLSPLL